jgi:two-component system chemotaxis response regulator CheY
MKILIVDDSKAMRMIVMRVVRQAGYGDNNILKEAADGAEALSSISTEEPNLILSDWNMPRMNGLELLQEVRKRQRPIPFGFVTTEYSQEMRDIALQAGADFLLAKPFAAEDLSRALDSIFRPGQ